MHYRINGTGLRAAALAAAALTLAVCPASAGASPSTADEVMDAVDARYDGDSRRQEGVLTLIDTDRNQRVRSVRELARKYGEDEKQVTRILSPAEVSGTAFLSYEWDNRGRADETWLYLPQLRKVKRLATTDKSAYFLGSDFTYSDLIGLEVDNYDYTFAEDNGQEAGVWTLIATPKADIRREVVDETGYVKAKLWVDQDKLMVSKAQYWLEEGDKVKYFTASDFEKISDIWVAKKMQMVLTQGGQMLHGSVYEIQDIEFNLPVDDEAFTTYALERPSN